MLATRAPALSNASLFDATSEGAHSHCRGAFAAAATSNGRGTAVLPVTVGHYENGTLPPPNAPAHWFES